jgi:hypothetical protein
VSLDTVWRDAVATADELTADLQVGVLYEAFVDDDQFGTPTYAAPVTLQAMVSEGVKPRETTTGQVIVTKAHILFQRPMLVTARDRFTLPSGLTASIVDTDAASLDPTTGRGYYTGVWLG